MTTTRTYESPLRDRQREETRRRILDAAIDVLAEQGDLTVPLVAEHAGVATRTVYYHFDSKDVLLDELAVVLDQTIGVWRFPEAGEDLIEYSHEFAEAFVENERLWRALVVSRAGSELRHVGRSRRVESLETSLGERLDGLSPGDRQVATAVVYMQFAVATRLAMLDHFALSPEQASRGAAWAIRSLIESLERNPKGPIE